MPQQGARPAVGDQGSRGAVLTPLGRLTLAGAGVIVGGSLVAAGTRITWTEVSLRGTAVDAPGLPPVLLGGGVIRSSGGDLGAGYLFGLGLLLALVPLGWLVVGPRGRVALSALGIALAVGIGVGTWIARADATERTARLVRREIGVAASFRVRVGAGPAVTAAGAALAGLASIGGGVAGGGVPKLGMPGPPDGGASA